MAAIDIEQERPVKVTVSDADSGEVLEEKIMNTDRFAHTAVAVATVTTCYWVIGDRIDGIQVAFTWAIFGVAVCVDFVKCIWPSGGVQPKDKS